MTKELDSTVIAIFGGCGDLSWRKLIPSLFDLFHDKYMPEKFAIIVIDRAPWKQNDLYQHLLEGIKQFSRQKKVNPKEWKEFSSHIQYLQGDFAKLDTYEALKKLCNKYAILWKEKPHNIFYMATPPSVFGEISKYLSKAGLAQDRERSRIVVEKPLGYDLKSAQDLNKEIGTYFNECQIFRIDHYLGKETVQNILALRFANPFLEPLWNRRYIECVMITVAEKIGVGNRAGYYERVGAMRDMIQNHILQVMTLIAMEPMVTFSADEIRNKNVDVLHSIRPITPETVHLSAVRGQYDQGRIDNKKVCGYREEEGVAPLSPTETFVALKLFVDNWRWQDVPFYLRTGKRLEREASEIVIQYRVTPHQSFPPEATLNWQPSQLILSIQPDQGVIMRFLAKRPGLKMHLSTVDMRFNYEEAFTEKSWDAYETLLWDIMSNDATLFKRADQIEASWKLLMPILEMWETAPPSDFPNYAAGSWGPQRSQDLLAQLGHSWPLPSKL